MESRKTACMIATCVVGMGITAATAFAQAPQRDVVVEGTRIDPELQRRVSYGDLNLAVKPDQKRLRNRIYRTASDLCYDLNGDFGTRECTSGAVDSTRDQVALAIARAERQMAGLAVGPPIAISMVIGVVQ